MTQKVIKKSVTFIEAIAIVVGMIIGSGIFLKPGIIFNDAGSPIMGSWRYYNFSFCTYNCRGSLSYTENWWTICLSRRIIWRSMGIFIRMGTNSNILPSISSSLGNSFFYLYYIFYSNE